MSEKIKSIKKSTLDDLIANCREYKKTSDIDYLNKKYDAAHEISMQAYSVDYFWSYFSDFVTSALALKPDADNAFIYGMLNWLDYQIEEAEQ